jgi:hypothetical protein
MPEEKARGRERKEVNRALARGKSKSMETIKGKTSMFQEKQ